MNLEHHLLLFILQKFSYMLIANVIFCSGFKISANKITFC